MRIKDKQLMKINALDIRIGDFIPARGIVTEAIYFEDHMLLAYTYLNGITFSIASNRAMLIRR